MIQGVANAASQEKAPQGKLLHLRNVPVIFPFEPYTVQRVLMERVIETAQTGANALLESPTGTGKTLSLLCSTRAWQQTLAMSGAPDSIIIYASRTHAQLEQAANELRRTMYGGNALILGSRETQCSNPDVLWMNGRDQIHACKERVDMKMCRNRDHALQESRRKGALMDIEDLAKAVKNNSLCPYYYVRDSLSSTVEGKQPTLLFMPYNYLVDPTSRRGINIPWPNSVVVIDEAHNIEDVCEEAYSFSLDRLQLAGAVIEIDTLMKKAATTGGRLVKHNLDDEELRLIKALFKGLADAFEKNRGSMPERQRGGALFDIFRANDITFSNYPMLRTKLEECVDALAANSKHCAAVVKAIIRSFELGGESCDEEAARKAANEFYRLIIVRGVDNDPRMWRVNFWCFSAGIVMKELKSMGVRSIIVASGTLTPIDSFGSSLCIPFNIKLESPHVVPIEQVWLGVVSKGVTKQKLNCSFGHRDKPEYQKELGNTLAALAKLIPDGLLVFFPSYGVLETCVRTWKASDVWSRLEAVKTTVIVEQRQSNVGPEYDRALENGHSAMLLAVCRGKASEGMDFKDHRARGVIVVGIPFPNAHDERVVHKKTYLDEARLNNPNLLTPQEWYTQQGYRAVNQAIGRAIRHEKDFGAIILLDERFTHVIKQLSAWLRPCFRVYDDGLGDAVRSLAQFFKKVKELQPVRVMPELPNLAISSHDSLTGMQPREALQADKPDFSDRTPGLFKRSDPNTSANPRTVARAQGQANQGHASLSATAGEIGPSRRTEQVRMSLTVTNNRSFSSSSVQARPSAPPDGTRQFEMKMDTVADRFQQSRPNLLPNRTSSALHQDQLADRSNASRVNFPPSTTSIMPFGPSHVSASSRATPDSLVSSKVSSLTRPASSSLPSVVSARPEKQPRRDLSAPNVLTSMLKKTLDPERFSEFKCVLIEFHGADKTKPALGLNQRLLHVFASIPDITLRNQLLLNFSKHLSLIHRESLLKSAGLQ